MNREGVYGFLHVYGDDIQTPEIDGALPGDVLVFSLWDDSAGLEYRLENVLLSPGDQSTPSPVPPVWSAQGQYALNIDTTNHFGDIDADGLLNLKDALLALSTVSNSSAAVNIYEGVDVNGDRKIGLQEVIYLLRHIAEF